MITLLASILGFITSLIPELIKLLRDFYNKNHELKILDKKLEYYNLLHDNKLNDIIYSAQYSTRFNINNDINKQTGIKIIDALNATVRPLITYGFFFLYVYFKLVQYYDIISEFGISSYTDIIWSSNDQAIFASIISFYFGQRTFNKIK